MLFLEAALARCPMMPKYNPLKTNPVEIHCVMEKWCPKYRTLNKMVKNLRVVVMVVQSKLLYQVMVKKIKICPTATAKLRTMRPVHKLR